MKRTLLVLCLALCTLTGSANSFTGLWGGIGLAKTNNYGLSNCAGLTYYYGISYGIGIGANVLYQKYNMYYSDQANAVNGTTVRLDGAYAFVSPMFVFHVVRSGQTQAYVGAGVGYSVGTTDSVHKWSHTEWSSAHGKYDSMIDGSKTLKKMAYRIGFGMTHYYGLGGNWRLAITEDVGILPAGLGSYEEAGNQKLNSDMVKFFKPVMFTIRLGITYRTPTADDHLGFRRMSGR